MPVLSRLFSPRDFGVLGVYLAIVAILSVVGSWRMEHAILIEADDMAARSVARLCLRLCLHTGIGVLLLLLLLDLTVLQPSTLGLSRFAYYVVPIGLSVSSLVQVQTARLLRAGAVGPLARARVLQAAVTAVFSLGIGFVLSSAELLIVATVAGQGIALLAMGRYLADEHATGRLQLVPLLRRYKRFPLFTLPADVLSAGSAQMPIFLLAAVFGPGAAGMFLLAQRTLLLPLSVVGSAVTDVYKSDASRLYAQQGSCQELARRILAGLTAVSIIPAVVLLCWSPDLFAMIFGSEWRQAGELCRILAIPAFIRLIATPISYNFYLAQHQAEDLIVQGYSIVSNLCIFGLAYLGNLDLQGCIVVYGANLAMIYIYYILRSLALAADPRFHTRPAAES